MAGPLTGLKIVEMVGIGPAPFCAMMFADMGAEVIRIDRIPSLEVRRMMAVAQREVAQPGRRRKSFADDMSWRQLRRRLGHQS